jgi:quinolinate synthase
MKKNSPEKEFINVISSNETCSCSECNFMKLNTLEKLYFCMKNENPEIVLDIDLMNKARKSILRMLDMSN